MGFIWFIIILIIINVVKSVLEQGQWERAEAMNRAHAEYVAGRILECFTRMLAFISKADGRISKCEVDVASECLKSLGITEEEYQRCVRTFNDMRDFSHEAFRRCAAELADIATTEACTLIYEMLWIVAAADGVLEPGEDELLRMAAGSLRIDGAFYHYLKIRYFGSGSARGSSSGENFDADAELEKAYAKLGCSPSDSDDAVKAAYRKAAMRYHPDRLRAEGLPEGMIAQATRSMAEINAAWDLVKKARRL